MSNDEKEPCGNLDCDLCYPLPHYKISTEIVKRVFHEREIKASSIEEALRIYAEGTARPSSYDERLGAILSEEDPVVTDAPSSVLEAGWNCYHRLPVASEHGACDDKEADL